MTANKTIKQIRLIYFIVSIMLGTFALLSFIYVAQVGQVYQLDPSTENNLKSLIIILALAGIPACYMFHKRKVSHINQELSIDKKLLQYRSSYFIKIVTLEGISLLCLLLYLMTGNINQLMIFGLVYLFLLLNYPGKSTIQSELKINLDEL